ncbi:TPA: ferric reductase-like transmembrane domain-containing protein [Pseudomonas putida]|uniref:ferric reductase-like transmembrane domain-containing protein n=1 Tax=Pseudomonas TaxID=286 RepID=UPI0004820CF6|nr:MULTISPECIES: ferric reductase-like transmembrane domain-containing protein [Pseudomonas]MDD2149830.1 ferric reductase-like transmembrane domain-containing protein [Pseudomonas putida]RAS33936.1 DMSO/TMAO reductase YedYZ heme-binding membrane subunit [Pseudomonas sp. URMO17WK12:I7]SME89657.1 DMSO/TMAO reductase YedYZ, heme-binding membrane subunit [Pseudomonas sp. URMO17WK12:I5]HDS1679713.1 ferric reductase-like transmembrane domain-containing protein [Pseudomonas putida]
MKPLTLPSGWKLFAALAGLTLCMTAAVLLSYPPGADGLRSAIRATARSSFALFLLAFLASSLVTFLPGSGSRRLLRERRYVGLAFAFSHTVHGLLIYRYAQQFPELFWAGRTVTTSLPGSIGYLFLLLLTLTSFKAPMRLLGGRAWKALHSTGMWVLAGVFCLSFYKRIPMGGWYPLAFALMFSAMALKLTAKLAQQQRRTASALS